MPKGTSEAELRLELQEVIWELREAILELQEVILELPRHQNRVPGHLLGWGWGAPGLQEAKR